MTRGIADVEASMAAYLRGEHDEDASEPSPAALRGRSA
jgi:hypothetical protein